MKFLKIITALPVIIFLSGCVTTAAQQTYNSAETTLSNIGAEIKSCTNSVWNSEPKLKNALSVENSKDPQKTKNNKSYISQSDKKSMTALIDKMNQCRERGQEKIENSSDYYVRSFAPISQESIDLRNEVFERYLKSEITAGAAASSLENIHQYLIRRWEDQQQRVANQLNQQHFQQQQAQAAAWQAIGASFQNYSRQQQQYQNSYNQQQISKPLHTQCRWDAGVMNCTSYQY